MTYRQSAHALLILALGLSSGGFLHAHDDRPETVMVTFRARPGADGQLAEVIARHYETARRLALLREEFPHVTLRGDDGPDRIVFVEIFTWRSASVPDAAPPEIQAIWKEMRALVEARGGHAPLELTEMTVVGRRD